MNLWNVLLQLERGKMPKIFVALALLLIVESVVALGNEIKILDSQGISRAMKRNVGEAVVEISLKAPSGTAVSLENVDGLAPNVDGALGADGKARLKISSGTWRINSSGQRILEVKILPPGP